MHNPPDSCRHKHRDPPEYDALLRRLSRIEGQVRGVRGMVEKEAYCTDILIQVSAIQSALNAFSREFFEETLIHPCHMSTISMMAKAYGHEGVMRGLDNMTYGAYKMLGQLDFIPIDPNATEERGERVPTDLAMADFMKLYQPYSGFGATAQIFSDPRQHGGGRIFKSREELEETAAKGVEEIYDLVSHLNLEALNEALGEYQVYAQGVAEKFPRVKRHR